MVSTPYRHVVSFALDHPWAISRPMLETVAEILARRVSGQRLSADEIDARLPNKDRLPQPTNNGGVAVIPLHGVIVPRGNMMTDVSGATSLEEFTGHLRAAVADEKVGTILLDVDSPGGSVAGMPEAAAEIMRARTQKPVVAIARYTMASGALWLGAAATKLVASPSAYIGSVGAYAIHDDLSKAFEQEGIKRTYIASDPRKIEGNESEPLTSEGRAQIQKRVDQAANRFRSDLSRGRSIPISQVRERFGEGRMFTAEEALEAGMVDEIATYEQTVAGLLAATPSRRAVSADTSTEHPVATSQEPSPATDQERPSDARFRSQIEDALLELSL